jgi:NifU-like protein involved in Fe-S cluster formation
VTCGTGVAHNPACGDKVTMDVALADGRIEAIAHDTRACVLTQASAAILGSGATGMNREEVALLHTAVSRMLAGGGRPDAPFETYALFDGVADHAARHRCVLLPIEAALAAFDAMPPSQAV